MPTLINSNILRPALLNSDLQLRRTLTNSLDLPTPVVLQHHNRARHMEATSKSLVISQINNHQLHSTVLVFLRRKLEACR
jgi:hypothetical protein